MTIQDLVEFYTLETLAARLNRSRVGIRIKLRKSGRIPEPLTSGTGNPLRWNAAEIEALIERDPGLVLPAKAKGDGQ